jgi:hypothetical protein
MIQGLLSLAQEQISDTVLLYGNAEGMLGLSQQQFFGLVKSDTSLISCLQNKIAGQNT